MLHIGGARTALFSWLYARHCGGTFRLRIEDTDQARSTPEAVQAILDGLAWLGIDWDGDPVFQSRCIQAHRDAVDRLLREGKAYRCYCTKEELAAMREAQRAAGRKPMYDGRCRELVNPPPGRDFVVRFRSPDEGITVVQDLVLGDVVFDNRELDDLILMRADGTPTYNLAVVVDDHNMGISHVVRGADHLNNTPRQLQLYEALGFQPPRFAHIPLILAPDGSKMSKRHGSVAITEYREKGYLPQAMVNYLARLGWSHGDQEVFSKEELIRLFDLKQVGKTAARFDLTKLDWLNAHYLRSSQPEDLADEVAARLQKLGVDANKGADLLHVIALLQPRSRNLQEMAEGACFFYRSPEHFDEKAVRKHFKAGVAALLEEFIARAEKLQSWDSVMIHALLTEVCEAHQVKLGRLCQPIRILLCGRAVSPPIDETLALLGKEESMTRLRRGLERLRGDLPEDAL